MNNSNETETKVISLSDRANRTNSENAPAAKPVSAPESFDFEAIMKRNLDNSSRQRGDREKANKGVIRSYRLKH